MGGEKNGPRLETANTFRHGLFNCFFDEELLIRSSALKTLGHVVDYWTSGWQDYLRTSWTPLSPHLNRPPIARQSSNGSGISPAPSSQRGILRRDSSFKMHFEDVFGLDADDLSIVTPRILEAPYNNFLPLTPEKEDSWTSISGVEYAVSPTETGSFTDGAVKFSNRGLGDFEFAKRDLAWAGRQVSEEIWGLEEMKTNLENFYTWLLRFSLDCPFKDVRKGCREILKRAERAGAQIPEVPVRGPSFFIPLGETIGLNYGPWTPATPNPRSPNPLDLSEDEEDGIMFSPRESSGNGNLASGIMIPDPNKTMNGDRTRSTSRGRTPVGSFGRGSRRTTVSMVSSLFQTPPSPPNGLNTSYKFKRRNHPRRQIPKFLPKPKPPSDDIRYLQVDAYMRTGRVGNLNKILFHFPRFAEVNREATDLFVSDDSPNGPLPQKWRIYLGIIAAAEKKCQYYLSLLSEKFLTIRGEKEWLKGIQNTPPKLQRISKLNMLLAHRPWTITQDHVKELIRGDESEELDPEHKWTTAEALQAIIIMSFYHGKSAMALAWGILPEADLLGGTVRTLEKCTPVAPFGSFVQSSSTDPPSEGSGGVRRDGDSLKSTSGHSSRKRAQVAVGQGTEEGPEKWRKTPTGSIPFVSNPSSPASPVLAPSDLMNVPPPLPKTEAVTLGTPKERHHHRTKSQKRRKSFEECATSEDAPPPPATAGLDGFSLSAPNSYVPFSSLSSARPLPARDYLLSPSSSTSSLFDTMGLLGEQLPVNVLIEDYTRFLHPESIDRQHEDFDPNSREYEFLPMEEFEWERNASSIISDYLDSVVDVLDRYFKEAQDADADDEVYFASALEMLPPRRLLTDEISSTRSEYSSSRINSAEFEDFLASPPDRHDRTGRSFISSGRSASSPPRYVFEPKSFKEAAWFYSLRLLGIQKDDFRYSEIKVLLDKGSRRYLKRVCAQPDMVSVADWVGAGQGMGGLRSEEKCLLALLACQARFMGEVLWGVRAVSEYIG